MELTLINIGGAFLRRRISRFSLFAPCGKSSGEDRCLYLIKQLIGRSNDSSSVPGLEDFIVRVHLPNHTHSISSENEMSLLCGL